MIILGDLAIPTKKLAQTVKDGLNEVDFVKNQSLIFNLEGLLTDEEYLNENKPVLFNNSSVLHVFEDFETKVACLSNNHTLDLPHLLISTKKTLHHSNYLSVGAGNINDDNFEFVTFIEDGYQVFLFNACWDFLLYNQNNTCDSTKVNTINAERLFSKIRTIKRDNNSVKIVFYFHWSFDLELLPSPSYRLLAKDLIDAGVNLVIGTHSHCIQGGESYKDGFILYGIGNFFLPSGIYAAGKLKFPKMSELGLGVEWNINKNLVKIHGFKTSIDEGTNTLKYEGNEELPNSQLVKEASEYAGFNDQEYSSYFKKHRRKKLLVPVFYDYKDTLTNRVKLNALKLRAKMARLLAENGIIKWQN